MTLLAPNALLTGAGIHDPTDPHLTDAGHIRLFPYPGLGLPVAPITVSRTIVNSDLQKRLARSDIVWIDSKGVQLSAPFEVAPDNPVTGWLPNDGRCIWIDLAATPRRIIRGPLDPRVPIDPRLPDRAPPNRRLPIPLPLRLNGIELAEITPTDRGDSVIQSRSAAPWQLAGAHIQRIRVSGAGTVSGVTWLDAGRFKPGDVWRRWTLPHDDARRYVSLPSALGDAKQRTADGAPRRAALYDAPSTTWLTAPSFADPQGHEVNRVTTRFQGDLEKALDIVLNDTSRPAAMLSWKIASFDEISGKQVGTIDLNLLNTLQIAGVDPGMSRWLGFADSDPDVRTLPVGTLVLYWIDSWWDAGALGTRSLLARLLALAMRADGSDLPTVFARRFGRDAPRDIGRLTNLTTVIPIIGNVPPDRPARPALGGLVSGPWNSGILPPDAARQVTLPLAGLSPAGQLAFARVEAAGPRALHEKGPDGDLLPVTAAVLPDALSPGLGELYDRFAPPEATGYRVAQTDWFGRWSDWAQGTAAAADRPRPPRPVPELFYTQPTIPDPMHSDPLSGTVRIRLGVPQPIHLAPGSLPVAALEIVLAGAAPELIPVPATLTELDFTRAGPALAHCATAMLTLTCRWQDSASRYSDPSPEISRTIRDPRPPVAVMLPETLAYGSRPDVTGKSRIQLGWTASPGQTSYRVYHSDETTLLTSLEREGAATAGLRAAIAAAPNPAARAALFVANKGRFDRTRFELVSPDGLAATRFEHRVSGSLRVLAFYRVVPMSAANVETPFAESSMIPFGIPNSGPPATPLLVVRPIFEDGVPQASVQIRVPQGAVRATEYRLRRSMVESRDPLKMPVAVTGPVPLLAADAGGEAMQEVTSFRDKGGSELKSPDPLKAWTAYSWAAEVRGAPEAGSSVAGEWSRPSPPVTAAIVPPGPPAAPTEGEWDGTAVSFTHPDPLTGGSMGAYTIDLYAQPPGRPATFAMTLSADAGESAGGRKPDRIGRFRFQPATAPASGTQYRAMVTDPAGRTSSPSAAVLIP